MGHEAQLCLEELFKTTLWFTAPILSNCLPLLSPFCYYVSVKSRTYLKNGCIFNNHKFKVHFTVCSSCPSLTALLSHLYAPLHPLLDSYSCDRPTLVSSASVLRPSLCQYHLYFPSNLLSGKMCLQSELQSFSSLSNAPAPVMNFDVSPSNRM